MYLQSLNAMSLTNLQVYSLKVLSGQIRGSISEKGRKSIREFLTPDGQLNHFGKAMAASLQNGSGHGKKR